MVRSRHAPGFGGMQTRQILEGLANVRVICYRIWRMPRAWKGTRLGSYCSKNRRDDFLQTLRDCSLLTVRLGGKENFVRRVLWLQRVSPEMRSPLPKHRCRRSDGVSSRYAHSWPRDSRGHEWASAAEAFRGGRTSCTHAPEDAAATRGGVCSVGASD